MSAQSETLFGLLDSEATAALKECHIYPISNYGWLDAYTADPEMIGHAMWQTSPPFEFDPFNDKTPVFTKYQEQLTIIGADFEGLMELV